MKPPGEPFESSGGLVHIARLFTVLVSALQKLALVVATPDSLEVSVDVELFRVGDVEVLEPPAQTLASGVPVEWSRDPLVLQPLVSITSNVSDVLSVPPGSWEPFGIDLEGIPLDDLEEFHRCHWTAGVPVWGMVGITISI